MYSALSQSVNTQLLFGSRYRGMKREHNGVFGRYRLAIQRSRLEPPSFRCCYRNIGELVIDVRRPARRMSRYHAARFVNVDLHQNLRKMPQRGRLGHNFLDRARRNIDAVRRRVRRRTGSYSRHQHPRWQHRTDQRERLGARLRCRQRRPLIRNLPLMPGVRFISRQSSTRGSSRHMMGMLSPSNSRTSRFRYASSYRFCYRMQAIYVELQPELHIGMLREVNQLDRMQLFAVQVQAACDRAIENHKRRCRRLPNFWTVPVPGQSQLALRAMFDLKMNSRFRLF